MLTQFFLNFWTSTTRFLIKNVQTVNKTGYRTEPWSISTLLLVSVNYCSIHDSQDRVSKLIQTMHIVMCNEVNIATERRLKTNAEYGQDHSVVILSVSNKIRL